MTDTNIETENGTSPAVKLGEKLRTLRVRHNLSLIDVSDKLKIRSHVLNDMENGNFTHLKEGECLAYARYMGIDLSEVRAVLAEGGSSGGADDGSRMSSIRTGIGIGALAVIAVGVVLLISSGGSDGKPEAEQALVSEPLRNGTGVLSEGEELNLSEIGSEHAALPDVPEANGPQPQAIEPVPVEIVDEPGPSGVQIIEEPVTDSVLPEIPDEVIIADVPESGVITFDEELKAAGNLPDAPVMTPPPGKETQKKESPKKDLSGREGRNPNAGYATGKPRPSHNSGNPVSSGSSSGKPVAKKETPVKPAPVQARKPLKAGEVRSLADEMGLKKTPAPAKAPAPAGKPAVKSPKDAGKPGSVAPRAEPRNLNGGSGRSAPGASGGKPAALRAGEVRSLAMEQGRTPAPAAKSAASEKTGAGNAEGRKAEGRNAEGIKVRQISGNGRVYDPDEVRRKADLVMKN